MVKISSLPVAGPPEGDELLPVVKDGRTYQTNVADLTDAASARSEAAAAQARDIVLPANIFIDVSLGAAEATVAEGIFFKIVDSAAGIATVYRRTSIGSDKLFDDLTLDALQSSEPGRGRDLVGQPSVAQLLACADAELGNPGAILHAGGFRYEIADPAATDAHLVTAGGVKLYVLPGNLGWNILAFGVANDSSGAQELAINNAMIAVNRAGGGELFFPEGRYRTLGRMFGQSGVTLVGEGRKSVLDNRSTESRGKTFLISFGDMHERDWQNQVFQNASWVAGNTKLTTTNIADAGNFTPGQVIFIYRGFPYFTSGGVPLADNALYAQAVRVISVNEATGAVTIDVELQSSSDEKFTASHPDFNAVKSYAAGDIVWHPATAAYYLSLVDANLGNAPAGITDANWGKETCAVTDWSGTSQLDGRQTYIADGGGMKNMAVRTTSSQWLDRSCCFETVFENIYVEESDTLFGGNGFNRVRAKDISGNFRRGATEMGEGTFECEIDGLFGQFVASAVAPKDELFSMNRPGCKLRNFRIHAGSHTFSQFLRIGSSCDDHASVARDGDIFGSAAFALIDLRSASSKVRNINFFGRGSTPTQFIYVSKPAPHSAVKGCETYGHNFQSYIVNCPTGQDPDATVDFLDFSGNKIFGAISTNKFRLRGRNGRIVENFVELMTAPNITESPDFATWEVARNGRSIGDHWDDILRIETTNNARSGLWYSPDVILSIGANMNYTMPNPSLCPAGSDRHTVKNATNIAAIVTVLPFATETFYLLRGSTAVSSVAIAPGETLTFRLDRANGNWVVL